MGVTEENPRITNLFVKPESGQPMLPVDKLSAVAGKGLEGDQSFGRTNRQVLLVNIQNLHQLELSPGMVRENVTIAGLEIDELASGTRLHIGQSQFEITGPCEPCWKMDRIRPGLQSELQGMRGVLAKVLKSGQISVGDTIRIQPASAD